MDPSTDRFWFWLAGACYFAGLVLGTAAVLRRRPHSRGLMNAIVVAGYALHSCALYLRGIEVRGCPLGNQFEIFQFTAWSATTLYLVVGTTFRISLLGYFTSMLSAALTLLSLAMPAWDATHRVNIFGGNAWIEFHAALALFSYGVFGLLSLTSILFLLRHFSLKNKRLDGTFAFLPSIVDLDQIGYRLLITGVALLATSLLVGASWWIRNPGAVNPLKIAVTASIWIAYATALGLRLRGRVQGKRLAKVCIALFAVALLSLSLITPRRPVPGPASVPSSQP
jgi:ABC-type uncharacterized transport system permease subunit